MTTDDRTLPLCDGAVFQQLMIINCPCTHEEQMIPMSVQTQDGYLGANGQCYCTISQASKAFPWGLLYLRDLSHWLSYSGLDTQHTIACDPQSPSLSPLPSLPVCLPSVCHTLSVSVWTALLTEAYTPQCWRITLTVIVYFLPLFLGNTFFLSLIRSSL